LNNLVIKRITTLKKVCLAIYILKHLLYIGGYFMTSNNKSLDLINMTKNLRKPFDANIKQGDKVHILTDFKHDPLVWESAAAIVTELGGEPIISLFSPRPADYYDPPESVCSAMLQADINVFLTTTGLFHS